MKNNLLKYYIAAFYLCSTFVMFAQDPGTGGGIDNDGTTDVTPAAPIDEKLFLLAFAGMVLAYYAFKKLKKHTVA